LLIALDHEGVERARHQEHLTRALRGLEQRGLVTSYWSKGNRMADVLRRGGGEKARFLASAQITPAGCEYIARMVERSPAFAAEAKRRRALAETWSMGRQYADRARGRRELYEMLARTTDAGKRHVLRAAIKTA
jgi:hypothetical protein